MTSDPESTTDATALAETIAGQCLAVRVRLLNRVVSNLYDHALRPLGITTSQMNILVVVAKGGKMRPGAIARILHMEKSTLSRNLERMHKRGWVAITPGEVGRSLEATLTPAGGELLQQALPRWQEAQARAGELIGEEGRECLLQITRRVWGRATEPR